MAASSDDDALSIGDSSSSESNSSSSNDSQAPLRKRVSRSASPNPQGADSSPPHVTKRTRNSPVRSLSRSPDRSNRHHRSRSPRDHHPRDTDRPSEHTSDRFASRLGEPNKRTREERPRDESHRSRRRDESPRPSRGTRDRDHSRLSSRLGAPNDVSTEDQGRINDLHERRDHRSTGHRKDSDRRRGERQSRSRSRSRSPARQQRHRREGDRSARKDGATRRDRSPEGGGVVRGRGRVEAQGAGGHSRENESANPEGGGAASSDRVRKAPVLGRSGGAYIPPFRLAQMLQEAEGDKSSEQYQRMTWEALRKSLNGVINKVNANNIKLILPELFAENLNRGQGLLCRCIMKAQAASPPFSAVFAALIAVVNTKFYEIGLLLVTRVVHAFKRAFKRSDKPMCIATLTFLAHLVNQHVVCEVIALQILVLLLKTPSDDSVEVAIAFVKEVGATLEDGSKTALHFVMERFRSILHEGTGISKRTQYAIEGMFAIRKAGFEAQGFVAVKPELDLVEEDDQIEHDIELEEKMEVNSKLDVFQLDPEYEQHEAEWAAIKKELLGEESDDEEGDGDEDSSDEDSDDELPGPPGPGKETQVIHDMTETNLVNLRRTIYLTIMSSMNFEEAGHKLLKLKLQPGQEVELCSMLCECCSQEKTYLRYYALLAQRFSCRFRNYRECFEELFVRQYALCHRLDTNKLRNLSKFFAHLVGTEAVSWGVLECVNLTENDTTSASRIFVKYFFQELSEHLGLSQLNKKLADPDLQSSVGGLFPRDSMINMRFAINYFTAIGLGGLTDTMRADLKSLQEQMTAIQQQKALAEQASSSDSDSSSSSGSDSDSSSSDSGSSHSD